MSDIRADKARVEAQIVGQYPPGDPFAAAVRATRMPMIITDPNRPDNPIVFVNESFCRLSGYGREEIVGRNCRFLQGSDTDPAAIARIRAAIAAREPVEIDIVNHRKDGSTFWNRLLISPVFDDAGALIYFFASQFDVTLERDRLVRLQRDRDALEAEVARRIQELGRSEQQLRFALKAGGLGAWSLDLVTRALRASDGCKENFGRDPADDFTYDDLIATIHPDDRARMQVAVTASVADRDNYEIEYRIITPSGETRWIEIRAQPFYDADGAPMLMTGVSLDVTQRKRTEEHRALLARELDHRVKNTLATVQSIAEQTMRSAPGLDEARRTLSNRIQSLSAAHTALTRTDWDGALLSNIVTGALAPFRSDDGSRFSIAGPEVRLPPAVALAVTMALHELATNASKYGALSGAGGRITLKWIVRHKDGNRLFLRWEESGGPEVTEPSRRGFGSRLIEQALSVELNGVARIEFRPEGVIFTVDAPLPEVEQTA